MSSTDHAADASRPTDPRHEPAGHDLDAWVALLAGEFGVDPAAVDVQAVLDLAREAAHGVGRPAVPLTGFFAGYAVAAGTRDRAEFDRVAARLTVLAQGWGSHGDDGTGG